MDDAKQTVCLERRRKTLIRWPENILGPRPGMKEINVACWFQFVVFLLAFLYLYGGQIKNQSGVFRDWYCDFINLYGIGRIANEFPMVRLYDYSLQMRIFNEVHPNPANTYNTCPYPPFVALFFGLLARLPFNLAYILWAGVSLVLYIAGIGATLRAVFPGERVKNSLIFCLALEFSPFIIYTLANGQLGTIAVASIGFAILHEAGSKPFRSGLALSFLAYKPTLFLLLIPMLLLTRRFRTFLGFATGATAMIAAETAYAGMQIWPAYARFLIQFGRVAGIGGRSLLDLSVYIDLSSFSYLVPGGRSRVGLAILVFVTSAVAVALAVLLWKSARSGKPAQYLAWASTLTWTLLLNVYVPIYDTVLVIIAIILTLGALKGLKWRAATGWVVFLSALIFVAPWETEAIAISHRIQLLSVLLAVLGLGQLFLLHRAIRQKSMQMGPGFLTE